MTEDRRRRTDHLFSVVCPPSSDGAIAQLGERVLCKHEVVGSIPSGSTNRTTRDRRGKTDGALRARPGK